MTVSANSLSISLTDLLELFLFVAFNSFWWHCSILLYESGACHGSVHLSCIVHNSGSQADTFGSMFHLNKEHSSRDTMLGGIPTRVKFQFKFHVLSLFYIAAHLHQISNGNIMAWYIHFASSVIDCQLFLVT